MLVTARLRPPDRVVEVADVRRVKDLLARLDVLPTTVLVIRDGDRVEVRFAISGGSGPAAPAPGGPAPGGPRSRPGEGGA